MAAGTVPLGTESVPLIVPDSRPAQWSAIDCGCGPLGGLAVLAELVGSAGRVVGVDVNEAGLDFSDAVRVACAVGFAQKRGTFEVGASCQPA